MTEELINKVATINCNDAEREEIYTALKKQIPQKAVEKVKKIRDYEDVSILCPECDWNVNLGDRYCKRCGQKLTC